MRITYRQLKMYLDKLHEEQLDCDVTIQFRYEDGDTVWCPAEFQIVDIELDSGLETNHPLLVQQPIELHNAADFAIKRHIEGLIDSGDIGPIGD
jgi:hypothetical protein